MSESSQSTTQSFYCSSDPFRDGLERSFRRSRCAALEEGPQQFDRRAYDDASPIMAPPRLSVNGLLSQNNNRGRSAPPCKTPISSPCQTLFKWKPHPNAMVKLHGLSEMPRYSLQDRQGVRDLVNLVNPSWTSLMRVPTHKHVQPAFTPQNPGPLSPAGSVVIPCGGD